MPAKLLFVDGEVRTLMVAVRVLQDFFDVDTASCGEDALRAVRERGPYAAVVTDLEIPGIDGVRFLQLLRTCSPATSRLILTAHWDVESLVEAVNATNAFKLLYKPCPVDVMREALSEAVAQRESMRLDALLLEKVVDSAVCVLSDVLALANPEASHRSKRISKLAVSLAEHIGAQNVHQVRIAAALSQIGCVAVSQRGLRPVPKAVGIALAEDAERLDNHYSVAARVLSKISALEPIASIIRLQDRRGAQAEEAEIQFSTEIKLAAEILRVASDFDMHTVQQGMLPRVAAVRIANRRNAYDPMVVEALAKVVPCGEATQSVSLNVADIVIGMVLEQGVVTKDGRPLIKVGTEVTETLLTRLRMFANNVGVLEPILVSTGPVFSPRKDSARAILEPDSTPSVAT
jgi:response regulator RpfG family c-di-GMP phosphodiesterase